MCRAGVAGGVPTLTWLIPRPRGASPRLDRSRAGRRREAPPEPQQIPVPPPRPPRPPSPPRLPGIRIRRGWAGLRALKGDALFLGWDGAGASRRGAGPGPGPALGRGGTGVPGDPAGPEVPSPDRVPSPSLVSWEGVWAFLVAPPSQMVASPGEPHGLFPRGTQEEIGGRGCGVTSGRREWTSLGPISEAIRPWVAASYQQCWPRGWGQWWLCCTPIQPLAPHQLLFVKP